MNSKIGVHLIPAHGRPSDIEYIRQLQPRSIKIIDPDVEKVSQVFSAAPNALFLLRNHPISEQKHDMYTNPIATGIRHANELHEMVSRLEKQALERGRPFPSRSQITVPGINEPPVWYHLNETVKYYTAFLDKLNFLDMSGCALNLSVGWPANRGADTPVDWSAYEPVHQAILRGNHYLVLHEYWDRNGPQHMWKWWAGRYLQCPWNDVRIIIGECGVDQAVAGPVGHHGWQGLMSPQEYVNQLAWYDEQVRADDRIHSFMPFTTDYT